MKKSISRVITDYHYTKSANSFINFLSHAFIFKKFFHEDLLGEYVAKEGLSLAAHTLDFLKVLFRKILYLAILLMLYAATQGIRDPFFMDELNSNTFMVFFMIMTLCGSILRDIVPLNEEAYELIMLMKIPADQYHRAVTGQYLIKEGLSMAIAFIVPDAIVIHNYLICLLMVMAYLSMHLAGEAFTYISIDRNNNIIPSNTALYITAMVILLPMAGVSLFTDIPAFLPPILIFLALVSGWLSLQYLREYPRYQLICNYNLTSHVAAISNTTFNSLSLSSETANRKMKVEVRQTEYTGYRQIQYLFEQRYQKSLTSGTVIFLIITVIGCLVLLIAPVTVGNKDSFVETIFDHLPMVVMFTYYASSTTKEYLQMCFMQMDRYLIHYSFYRNRDSIRQNLLLRYQYILKKSFLPVILITVTSFILMTFYRSSFAFSYTFFGVLFPIVSFMFFTLYQLALYYLLCPYTFDGVIANKIYPIIDSITYIVLYSTYSIQVTHNTLVYSLMLSLMVMVSLVLFWAVTVIAPKHFRIR